MTTPTSPAGSSGAPAARGGKVIWIAGVALVVLIGIVAVVASRGSKSDSDQAAEKQAAPKTVVTTAGKDAALAPFVDSAGDEAVGQTIPTVSGTTLDGKPISIGADGTAKIIMFVAHWCPHCQREVPLIAAHLKTTPLPGDVKLVTVSTSVAKERGNWPPAAWLAREGWTAPTMADSASSAAAQAYGLTSFPYFVVVDKEGKVVFRTSGEITVDQFDQLVQAARTGETPA